MDWPENQNTDCGGVVKMKENRPFDLKQTQFEPITTLRSNTQVRKDKESGVLVIVLRVLEVI